MMDKTQPYTFSDAEALACELERDRVVGGAAAERDGPALRVRIDLTEDAVQGVYAGPDHSVWIDLSSYPPGVGMRGVGDAEPLASHLSAAVKAASGLLGLGPGPHPSLDEAYAMAHLSPGCGIDAVQSWFAHANDRTETHEQQVRLAAAFAGLCAAKSNEW